MGGALQLQKEKHVTVCVKVALQKILFPGYRQCRLMLSCMYSCNNNHMSYSNAMWLTQTLRSCCKEKPAYSSAGHFWGNAHRWNCFAIGCVVSMPFPKYMGMTGHLISAGKSLSHASLLKRLPLTSFNYPTLQLKSFFWIIAVVEATALKYASGPHV